MTTISQNNLNGIAIDDVKTRLKQVNEETPTFWTTSIIKEPQELTVRMAARNNLMLDKVLANQDIIIANQNKMMQKMGIGENLNVQA